jgi:D-sedoheptulose 7-phosphate isomerase
MSRTGWKEHVEDLHRLLGAMSCTGAGGRKLGAEDAFARWRKMTLDLRARRRTIYLVGNGASASMASHMSADLAKNAHVHTQVFSDLSLITAISNDMGYEHVFSEPLSRRASAGDMLVAISSSGRSPNVLAAMRVAKKLKLTIVTLTGMSANNPLRKAGHLNFHVPAETYGYAESCHAAVLHHWMDLVESKR